MRRQNQAPKRRTNYSLRRMRNHIFFLTTESLRKPAKGWVDDLPQVLTRLMPQVNRPTSMMKIHFFPCTSQSLPSGGLRLMDDMGAVRCIYYSTVKKSELAAKFSSISDDPFTDQNSQLTNPRRMTELTNLR